MKQLTLTFLALLLALNSFADNIFMESFEYANHDNEPPIGWICEDQSWLCGYQDKDHNRSPHTGNWYAYTDAEESWMFMPLFFSSELKYRYSFWTVSDGTYEVEFWLGNEANTAQMEQQLFSTTVSQGEYDKVSVYIESIAANYQYFGIHAIAHEGAYHLTIDDVYVDMVGKYDFSATPSNADTVLYPNSQAIHHFDVQNLGYEPIDVILSPSHEYFTDIHFYVDGSQCTVFHLEPDETKAVTAEATLIPAMQVGATCWLDIMLVLDCNCATSMTTLWVTVIEPAGIAEHKDSFSLFPNPATDNILINRSGLQQVYITDVTGKRVVNRSTDQDELLLDVSQLKSGIYFVTTISAKGSETQKIVKD